MTNIISEAKVELVKLVMKTEEGWNKLALSIKHALDPVAAKNEIVSIFHKIGAKVEAGVNAVETGVKDDVKAVEGYVSKLEEHLKKLV